MEFEQQNYSRLERAFLRFHERNPEVYDLLVQFTREFIEKTGKRKLGIATVYERVRWEVEVTTIRGRDETFKLSNNHRAFYSRLIMSREQDLGGVFNIREQTSVPSSTRSAL